MINFPNLMKSKKLPSQEAEQTLRRINTESSQSAKKSQSQQKPESKKEKNESSSTEDHQYN